MRKSVYCTILLLTLLWTGCGTHGSIKGYQYATSKDSLQKAIMSVIGNSPNAHDKDRKGGSEGNGVLQKKGLKNLLK